MTLKKTTVILFFFSLLQPLSFSVSNDEVFDPVKNFDFSRCGYNSSNSAIPFIKAAYSIAPSGGDATELIQLAINKVSSLPLDKNGFRAAILLQDGTFKLYGKLTISTSGVVLRGSGQTVLVAAGNKRRTLIEISGSSGPDIAKTKYTVSRDLLSAGIKKLTLNNADNLKVGDQIFIYRPCTEEWIKAIGMDKFKGPFSDKRLDWKKGSRVVKWDREIHHIQDNTIYFHAPLTTELENEFGEAYIHTYAWPERINNVGIENLNCISEFDNSRTQDEEHSWICINISNTEDSWVRDINAKHFVSSAVMLQDSTKNITVDNCHSSEPVSEIGGLRRISFYNYGQLNLIKNCSTSDGRHDFVVGFCSAGPNVFLDCQANNAHNYSGSIESWACGALFDNVIIKGNDIRLGNIGNDSQGGGYNASNCIIWNSHAAEIEVSDPPHSRNFSYGAVAVVKGNSMEVFSHKRYPTRSLFNTQLRNRIGEEKFNATAASSNYPDENPPAFYAQKKTALEEPPAKQEIKIINARFVSNGKVFWSGHDGTSMWMGNMGGSKAWNSRRAVTRFVPGRTGKGLTDDFEKTTNGLLTENRKMFSFSPPLWYERRRDDHQWVKRKNADVWGPFLELPWARSGIGTAWDGLSKYNLTKFNPWYFSRIKSFADLCDQKQILLYSKIYQNHNIIEDSSHWVDYPWRPVNALQDTGFTEPFPFNFTSSHRYHIRIADEFYDISNPLRNDLHERYIRKYLDNLKDNTNVIHSISEQYIGTAEFTQFFFDIVLRWQKENNIKLNWSICTGKNVTDKILAQKKYRDLISVIDLRYWFYLEDGELYAPDAGKNKAWRMYFSEKGWRKKPPTTPAYLYKQVREYKDRYPKKALIANEAQAGPLPILMAGGAYPVYTYDGISSNKKDTLIDFVNEQLAEELWKMNPDDKVADPENNWSLSDPGMSYLIYNLNGKSFKAAIEKGIYSYQWFDNKGKKLSESMNITINGNTSEFHSADNKPALLLLKKSSANHFPPDLH